MAIHSSTAFLFGTSLLILAVTTPAFAQTAAPAASQQSGIGEIVVTAQKREQRLQDVPIAVTALSPAVLAANRVQNVIDLNALVPNLSIRETSGGDGGSGMALRGALSYGVGPGADREVGYYLDGIYIGNATASNFDLPDIERVEVLRGPQGTLFGRNATAGAISFVTPDPTGRFDFHQEFTVGNYNQFRSKTKIDFPSFGPFSASIAYLHTERRGDTRNLGAGTQWDYSAAGMGILTSPKWLGSQNLNAVQAAVKLEAADNLTFTYKFYWMQDHYTPGAMGVAAYGPGGEAALGGILGLQDPATQTPFSQHRPDAVNNAFTTPGVQREQDHILTGVWKITDNLSLKNTFGWRKVYSFAPTELGGLGGVQAFGAPFLVLEAITKFQHRQISDEAQLNWNIKPLTVTAGLLYYHQRQASGGPAGLPNDYAFYSLAGLSSTQPYVLSCANLVSYTCAGARPTFGTSKAAYIQAELHITSTLDLVGGFRETKDDKSGSYVTTTGVQDFRVSKSTPSFLVNVNYHPTRDLLLYAKYSTAFMSGGGNTGNFADNLRTYPAEKAFSWEAGVKSDLIDHHLRVNLALFSVKYTNVQYINGGSFCGDPTAGVCVINAGDARAKGAELEVTAAPVKGLLLNAGVGYTDYKILKLSPTIQGLLASGALFAYNANYRPKWTTNLSAQYDTQPLFGEAYMSFRVDANYRSRTILAPDAPAAYLGVASTPGIWLLNSRVALAGFDLGGHKAEVALWGRNLTNDDHMSFISTLGVLYPTNYEEHRTFGVDFKFDW